MDFLRFKHFALFVLCGLLSLLLFGCIAENGSEYGPATVFISDFSTPDATEPPTAAPTNEPTAVPTPAPDIVVYDFETLQYMLIFDNVGERQLTVALGADIAADDSLRIEIPCEIRLEGYSLALGGNIVADSTLSGMISFENGTLRAEGISALAPDMGMDLRQCETSFENEPEADGFYVVLASFNGTGSPDGYIHVKDLDELSVLSDSMTLPCFREGVSVKIDVQPEPGQLLPYIDEPFADLIWETEDAPDASYAAAYFNVRSFNGVLMADYGLGGSGYSRLEKIDFSASSGLSGQLPWEIRGNTVSLRVPLHVDEDYMKYARLDFGASFEGTAAPNPEAVNSDGSIYLTRFHTLTVTDPDGGVRVYSVDIRRHYGAIPVVYIETDKGAAIESKEDYINCRVSIVNTEDWGFRPVTGLNAGIRGRGNSTWKWDKKPYRVKFESGVSLFGLHKAKDWVLLANYADKSLIRNTVAFDMARGLSFDFVPHQYPVDVYLNGEYMGVYGIGEQIERNQERVDIDLNYDDPDTGYLLEVCGADDDEVKGVDYFHAGMLRFVTIRSPKTEIMGKEHFNFISDYVTKADAAVTSLGDYYEYVDETALADWVIMCELTCNIDTAFRRSCYITKDKGGKLKFGPLWDFDLSMGNFSRDNGEYESWASTGREYVGDTWFTYLIKDPKFIDSLKTRWEQVHEDIMARAMESIDRYSAVLSCSQEENFIRWPIWNVRAGYQPSSMKQVNTYEKQIQFLKDWLTAREAWLDNTIRGL